jgi:hypothetical protein
MTFAFMTRPSAFPSDRAMKPARLLSNLAQKRFDPGRPASYREARKNAEPFRRVGPHCREKPAEGVADARHDAMDDVLRQRPRFVGRIGSPYRSHIL